MSKAAVSTAPKAPRAKPAAKAAKRTAAAPAHPTDEAAAPAIEAPIGAVTTLPLFALCLSSLNVRQTERDADIASLAEDIAARGLKQNLVVIPAHFASAETEDNFGTKFEVVAGGRRFQALRLLAEAGRIAPDHPVPVMVEGRGEARETSLSENLHRVAMNPADEFLAFDAIVRGEGGGKPDRPVDHADAVAYCAKRFGVTVRHVEGRLRLASLAPEILEALRTGIISLDSAKAYAGSTDHKLQVKVFNAQAKQNWKKHDPREVRDALRGQTLRIDDGRVVFVTIDAYRTAGGRTEVEMFMATEGDERVVNLALLDKLCAEKAEVLLAERAQADGFAGGIFAPGCGYQYKAPKPPKGFEPFNRYEYRTATPEEMAVSIGIYTIESDGSGLRKVGRFKPVEAAKPAAPTRDWRAEQEAEQRLNAIEAKAAQLELVARLESGTAGEIAWPDYGAEIEETEIEDELFVVVHYRVSRAAIDARTDEATALVDAQIAEETARVAAKQAELAAAAGDVTEAVAA